MSKCLGTNLSEVANWGTQYPFRDRFKTARTWIGGDEFTPNQSDPVSTDADGWVDTLGPGQVARAWLTAGDSRKPATGRYVVYFNGAGTLGYGTGITKDVGASTANRHVIDYNGNVDIFEIKVLTTPAKQIRVYPEALDPGPTDASDIFDPTFLSHLSPYGVIRFMDWQMTNYSTGPGATFADRAKLTDATWSTVKGVPIEVMCELCNVLEADMWFCVHTEMSLALSTEAAALVDSLLNADRRIYVEYSNETWNYLFAQAQFCEDEGLALTLDSNAYQANRKYMARMTGQHIDAWRGAVSGSRTIAGVLATQNIDTANTRVMLEYEGTANKVDCVAVGAYFGENLGNRSDSQMRQLVDAMTVGTMGRWCSCTAIPQTAAVMRGAYMLATKLYGKPLVAYEGGQHLKRNGSNGNDAAVDQKFTALNRDNVRMQSIYTTWLNYMKSSGLTLMVHFTDCAPYDTNGRYGARESATKTNSESPKARALAAWSAGRDPWWQPIGRRSSR